jgi:hypothetical protein
MESAPKSSRQITASRPALRPQSSREEDAINRFRRKKIKPEEDPLSNRQLPYSSISALAAASPQDADPRFNDIHQYGC